MAVSETNESTGTPAGLDALFDSLAERLGRSARAAAVFGEPVERDGVTVIPVARARWGLGGGSGRRPLKTGEGVGGGGGAMVSPVGFIEIRGGRACYKPIFDFKIVVGLILAVSTLLRLVWKRRRA